MQMTSRLAPTAEQAAAQKSSQLSTTVTKSALADDGFYRINEICTGELCNSLDQQGPWSEFLGKQAYRVALPILNPTTAAAWPKDAQGWYLMPSTDPQLTKKLLFLNVSGATINQMHDPKVYDNLVIPETWCLNPDVVVPDKGIIPICQTDPLKRPPRTNKQFPIFSFSSLVSGIVIFLAMGFTVIYNLYGSSKMSFAAAMGE